MDAAGQPAFSLEREKEVLLSRSHRPGVHMTFKLKYKTGLYINPQSSSLIQLSIKTRTEATASEAQVCGSSVCRAQGRTLLYPGLCEVSVSPERKLGLPALQRGTLRLEWGGESLVPGHQVIETVNDSLHVSPDLLPPQGQTRRNRILQKILTLKTTEASDESPDNLLFQDHFLHPNPPPGVLSCGKSVVSTAPGMALRAPLWESTPACPAAAER